MTAPKQHSKLILTSGYIVRVVAALRFGSAKWHMQVDAGSPAGFILYETASTSLYFALNVAISTGGFDLARYAPDSHAGNRKRN